MDRLLFVDTETGGVHSGKHSLLSVGLVVWDSKEGIIDKKEIFIKYDHYIITKEASEINRFNEIKQNNIGVTEKEAIKEITNFINSYFSSRSKVVLAGHNVNFDIGFLRNLFENNRVSFEKKFSHRSLDTAGLIRFLRMCGLIKFSGGLTTALRYFHIRCNNRHGALSDATATAVLYEKLMGLVINREV